MIRFARTGAKMAVLGIAGALALAACGSSGGSSGSSSSGSSTQGVFGKVPAATGTPHGGTVTVAAPPNAMANWILPIITAADNSVFSVTIFDYQMWRPLLFTVNGVTPTVVPAMSLINYPPKASNGNKTITITLKSNYKWSNGKPITSKDILFWYDEMKAAIHVSPANWAAYTPGLGMPDEVASVSAPNATTFVFNFKKAINPTWFELDQMASIQPMPSAVWAKASASGPTLDFTVPANATKIYNYLASQSKSLSSYASSPLWQTVDGPYKLTSFNSTTGAFTMVPNPSYGGPHSKTQLKVSLVPFTSSDAEANAVKAGSVDVGYWPLTNLKVISEISANYNSFGYPDFGWTYADYNFKDTTGHFDKIIGQLYVRAALAHLQNQAGYIKAFMNGAGGQAFGPVPSIPKSPYAPSNALVNPYPFSPSAAANLLKSHGWKVVPGGTDTCVKPGSAANECGAGIPAGTKLAFTCIYGTDPAVIGEQMTNLAAEAAKVGIQIHLQSSNFNYIVQNYNDPAVPKNDNKWAMTDFGGFTNSTYPTTFGVFNCAGSSNLGGYCDKKADQLITASISSSNPNAVKAEAAYLTIQQPGLFQPNPSDGGGNGGAVTVWKKTLSGTPASFANTTQFYLTPEFWYFTK
jgi:peptide/nickel transport system substrate-binding protein